MILILKAASEILPHANCRSLNRSGNDKNY